MKSLKIKNQECLKILRKLVLATFLFQPFLAFANAQVSSCRLAIENLENVEDIGTNLKKIKALREELENLEWGNQRIWREVLFYPNLSPIELSKTIEDMMKIERYGSPSTKWSSWRIIENIIKQVRDFIDQEDIFNFPRNLHLDAVNSMYVGPYSNEARKLPLIELIDAKNPKLVAIVKGLGADVYIGSPYSAELLSMMNDVYIGPVINTFSGKWSMSRPYSAEMLSRMSENLDPKRNPNDFRIKYPIPLALERFSAQDLDRKAYQQIVELLLESSDPNFRYNYNEMDEWFNTLFIIKYPGNPKIDKALIYGIRDGASDLMLVAQYGTADMLKSLIDKGHDITAKDKEGWGVEDYAKLNRQKEDREEILKILKEYERQARARELNSIYVGPDKKARELPLVKAIDTKEELGSISDLISSGADVYAVSPYGSNTIAMGNETVVFSGPEYLLAPYTYFKVRYPIPFALQQFSASTEGSVNESYYQKIVELLLEKSNPKFKYSHQEIIQKFGWKESPMDNYRHIDRLITNLFNVQDGVSDVLLVAQYGTADMLKFLIEERGHDIYAQDRQNRGVEYYAPLNSRYAEILPVLKEYRPGNFKYWTAE